jgi:Zn-dependent protease with chaperone function
METLFGKLGLDGHVQRNRLRIVLLFLGFLAAAEVVCLPLAAVATLFVDTDHSAILNPGAFLARWPAVVAIGASILFLVQWLRFPVAVGARMAAESGSPACRRVERLVRELSALNGIQQPAIRMVESPALNAFAAGTTARQATIIVTTGLERALDDDELRAVLAHEVAHLVFGDTRVMGASAVMLQTLDILRRLSPWSNGLGWKSGLMLVLLPILIILGMALSATSAIADTIGRAARLVVASSREFIADAEAIRMTRNPAALVSALRKIEGRSGVGTFPRAIEAMMIDGLATGADATHPTIDDRVRTIAGLTGEHFPLPAAALAERVRPAPVRPAPAAPTGLRRFAPKPKPTAGETLGRLFAGTAFAKVREGQGPLVKKSKGFKIAAFAGGALLALAYVNTFMNLPSADDPAPAARTGAAERPGAGLRPLDAPERPDLTVPAPVMTEEPGSVLRGSL